MRGNIRKIDARYYRRSRAATLSIAAVGVLSLVLAACSSSAASASPSLPASAAPAAPSLPASAAPASPSLAAGKVGYSEAQFTDSFQVLLVKLIGTQATGQGVNVLPAVSANGDPAKQNADIATILSQGVNALIVSVVDSNGIVPAVEKANAANVPVIAVDTPPNGGKVYMTAKADNVLMGQRSCEEMGKRLNGKGSVVNMQGALASANGLDRSTGFTDCMAAKFPGITVASKPMNWDPAVCTNTLRTLMSTTVVDGVYMGSDTICLPGLTQLLQNVGKYKKVGEPGHIVTVAIDGTPFAMEQIRLGYMDADMSQPIVDYAKYAVLYSQAAMAGKTFSPGPTDHNSTIAQLPNGNLVDNLPAPDVTAANVDDPTLWGNATK